MLGVFQTITKNVLTLTAMFQNDGRCLNKSQTFLCRCKNNILCCPSKGATTQTFSFFNVEFS